MLVHILLILRNYFGWSAFILKKTEIDNKLSDDNLCKTYKLKKHVTLKKQFVFWSNQSCSWLIIHGCLQMNT